MLMKVEDLQNQKECCDTSFKTRRDQMVLVDGNKYSSTYVENKYSYLAA